MKGKDFMICMITDTDNENGYIIKGNKRTIDNGITIEEYEKIDGNNVIKSRMFLNDEVMEFLAIHVLERRMKRKRNYKLIK